MCFGGWKEVVGLTRSCGAKVASASKHPLHTSNLALSLSRLPDKLACSDTSWCQTKRWCFIMSCSRDWGHNRLGVQWIENTEEQRSYTFTLHSLLFLLFFGCLDITSELCRHIQTLQTLLLDLLHLLMGQFVFFYRWHAGGSLLKLSMSLHHLVANTKAKRRR